MVKQRQIIVHSDYANGDTEGPYRDGRVDDTLVSPNTVRVYDGVLADGYLELSHDGVQAKVESSLGAVNVDGVVVTAHAGRHLGGGADAIYVVSHRDPLTTDDGYAVGMRWLNTVDGYEFTCFSNAPVAAQWQQASGSGGGGISEVEHEALDTLVHEIDETSYEEYTYSGGNVTNFTIWASVAKIKKIREEQYTYASNKVSQVVTIQYDDVGVAKMTMTETYTYTGNRVSSVSRVKT
jgi:hypothetical protein